MGRTHSVMFSLCASRDKLLWQGECSLILFVFFPYQSSGQIKQQWQKRITDETNYFALLMLGGWLGRGIVHELASCQCWGI